MNNNHLDTTLKELRLSGLAASSLLKNPYVFR